MIAQADAVRIPLPDKSIHCCVTSPPYWGLRKYQGEQGEEPLGLEATPERHVERIVEIFREVRRVLRDDGVCFLNYGDSFSSAGGPIKEGGGINDILGGKQETQDYDHSRRPIIAAGNLMMMPHRVALALQADGWIVRQDLVWFKRNPMPESVNGWRWQRSKKEVGRKEADWDERPKGWQAGLGGHDAGSDSKGQYRNDDAQTVAEYEYGDDLELKRGSWRHTRAHEYVFMLTKKMQYWSNQEAVREGNQVYTRKAGGYDRLRVEGMKETRQPYSKGGFADADITTTGRNPRSVLDIPTAPYKGAHYATFPPNLIAPLIRATCPRWACPVCGQGWAAVVDAKGYGDWSKDGHREDARKKHGGQAEWNEYEPANVIGYRPTCSHEHTQEEAVPGIVFDPFVGSGTSVMVAQDLLRRGIGIDLSMEYLDLQAKVRIGQGSPSNVLDDLPLFQ